MKKIALSLTLVLVFVLLIFVGKYKSYFDPMTQRVVNFVKPIKKYNSKEDLIFDIGFNQPLACKSLLPEIKTLTDFDKMFETLVCADIGLDSVYDMVKINSQKQLDNNILKIDYAIGSEKFSAHVFYHPNAMYKNNASLIIPASGEDVSWKMENNMPTKGYRLDDILKKYSDTYILIKPNESVLALHHKGLKMSYDMIYARLLNKGKSYSKLYMQHAIAVVKYLKLKHQTVATFGLSQGGLANVIVSEFASPNYAWVCGGYSQLCDNYYYAGSNQIIANDIQEFIHSNYIKTKMKYSDTQYYFSYGKEDDDFYNYEYNHHDTEKSFKEVKNTNFVYFNDGHDYPYTQIEDFVKTNFKN